MQSSCRLSSCVDLAAESVQVRSLVRACAAVAVAAVVAGGVAAARAAADAVELPADESPDAEVPDALGFEHAVVEQVQGLVC